MEHAVLHRQCFCLESLLICLVSQGGRNLLDENLNGTVAKQVSHGDLNSSHRELIGVSRLNWCKNVLLKSKIISVNLPCPTEISFSLGEYEWVLK